jgi:hypothetical protein
MMALRSSTEEGIASNKKHFVIRKRPEFIAIVLRGVGRAVHERDSAASIRMPTISK